LSDVQVIWGILSRNLILGTTKWAASSRLSHIETSSLAGLSVHRYKTIRGQCLPLIVTAGDLKTQSRLMTSERFRLVDGRYLMLGWWSRIDRVTADRVFDRFVLPRRKLMSWKRSISKGRSMYSVGIIQPGQH
jgi:hypothetical protein